LLALYRFLSLEPQEQNPFLLIEPIELNRVENARTMTVSRSESSVGLYTELLVIVAFSVRSLKLGPPYGPGVIMHPDSFVDFCAI